MLSDVTAQPIMFVLLFAFVFGASIATGGGASYREFLLPGIPTQNALEARAAATLMKSNAGHCDGANLAVVPIDAFDMAIVHRVFRTELHNAPGLVRDVNAGDTKRSAIVGDHLNFIVAALHNHHAAEDELIWPKLHARAPAQAAEIARMEGQHRAIADGVDRVQDVVVSWAVSADPRLAEQLIPAVENMSAVVDEHLADEELNIVPLINQHITSDEWQQAVARAAEFISRKNLRLGLVLGGYVFDAASASEGQRIMSDVPLPKRVLLQLLAKPAFAKYRRKIYG